MDDLISIIFKIFIGWFVIGCAIFNWISLGSINTPIKDVYTSASWPILLLNEMIYLVFLCVGFSYKDTTLYWNVRNKLS